MNAPTEAVLDGLLRPTGAVANGPAMRAGRAAAPKQAAVPPVVIARPGVGAWACDACDLTGRGWPTMDAHARTTGHRVFSPR